MKFKQTTMKILDEEHSHHSPAIDKPTVSANEKLAMLTATETSQLLLAVVTIVCLALVILVVYIFYKLCYKKIKFWASRSSLEPWTQQGRIQSWANQTEHANDPYVISRDCVHSQESVHFHPLPYEQNDYLRCSCDVSRLSRTLVPMRYNEQVNQRPLTICSMHDRDFQFRNSQYVPVSSRISTLEASQIPRSHHENIVADERQTANPLYDELDAIDTNMFQEYINTPKILLTPIERSKILEVEGKLIVYITREVDSKGAILILDNMGISLTVPAGAIEHKQLIILALNWDLSDNPFMEDSQALVSPVVYCGPHGVQLKSPALLCYKHCAFDPRGIQILESGTELTANKEWGVYCDAIEEEGKCKITQDECQVLINHFTLFTSIQSPYNGDSNKWLQVAVFSSPLKPGIEHYHLRIYFLNKTPCALQWAKHNESQFSGELVCPEKVFLLKGNKEDAILELLYLSHDWENVNSSSKESVIFQKIWHGMCPRAEFCFHRNLKQDSPREININFSLFQKQSENVDKIVIQMAETAVGSFSHGFQELNVRVVRPTKRAYRISDSTTHSSDHMSFTVRPGGHHSDNTNLDVEINPGGLCWEEEHMPSSRLREVRHHDKTKIPLEVKRKLVLHLAPMQEIGTDWRDFAAAMGFNCIPFLQTLNCPMTTLLDYFETQGTSLLELRNIFLKINRPDAACVIEELLGSVPKETCEHSESDNE